MDMKTHLTRQIAFSRATFGPAERTEGVLNHMAEEIGEVRKEETAHGRAEEWVDLVILALDGLTRAIRVAMDSELGTTRPLTVGQRSTADEIAGAAVQMIFAKQAKNEVRDWPDWRAMSEAAAINHDRSGEEPREHEHYGNAPPPNRYPGDEQ